MWSLQICAPMPAEFASAGSQRSSPCSRRRSRCTEGLRFWARWREQPTQVGAFLSSPNSNTWRHQIWLWSNTSTETAERHRGTALTSQDLLRRSGPKGKRRNQVEPESQTTRRKRKGFPKALRGRPAFSPSTLPARRGKKSGPPAARSHKKRTRTDRDPLKMTSDFPDLVLI